MKGETEMKNQVQEVICLCRDCGNLDYAKGYCKKCKGTNLEMAFEQMNTGIKSHSFWMRHILEQQLFAVKDK